MRAVGGQESSGKDHFRVCADCRRSKSVRGVWYLVPGRGDTPFLCETCFASVRAIRAVV